jgi:integrase
MATIKFFFRNSDKDKEQTIYFIVRNQNDKLVYSSGLKVNPTHWNTEKMRVKNVSTVKNRDAINSQLDRINFEINSFIMEQTRTGKGVNMQKIKEFAAILTGKEPEQPKTLFPFIQGYIEKSKNRANEKTGKDITISTIKKYNTCYNYLKKYAKIKKINGGEIDFQDITLDFYLDFTEYLKKTLNLSTNTVGKQIAVLKMFLRVATDKGLKTNPDFKSPRFKIITEDSDSIYLNSDELTQLYSMDLSENNRLEKIRDLFLVGAFTGCRFSDVTNIKKENVKVNMIEVEQIKTGKKVSIPFHPIVKAIWEKYNGELPRNVSNQKFNDYIKEVCKLAGLNEPTSKSITKGGLRISQRFEKWEMVTSHTARRSFATNLYKSGFPSISIMAITGHKTETSFLKYIKVTPDEHAKLLELHWQKEGNHLRIAK